MLSRIRASTRASSLATPKSSEPMIGAVPSRAIAWPYITISWSCDPYPEGTGRNGEPSLAERVHGLRAAGDLVDGLDDGLRGHGSVPRDATDRGSNRFEEHVDHVIAVADPVCIITTGIMIVMNGYTSVSSFTSAVARRIAFDVRSAIRRRWPS